jgi:hypothetical protein
MVTVEKEGARMRIMKENEYISLVNAKDHAEKTLRSCQEKLRETTTERDILLNALKVYIGEDYMKFVINVMEENLKLSGKNDKLQMELAISDRMLITADRFPCWDLIHEMYDMEIQSVLRDLDRIDLVVAISQSSEEVKRAIYSNMSSRMRTTVQSDVEYLHHVTEEDVRRAKLRITKIIRRKIEDGDITGDRKPLEEREQVSIKQEGQESNNRQAEDKNTTQEE